MPDLGRCGEVGDEKRSDSLDDFPRVVGVKGEGEERGASWKGMNLGLIEEHQVGDLVFVQAYYLYILLEATSACVIVPIAKVPRTQDSSYR